MSDYTPTTEEVRAAYIGEPGHWLDEQVGAEFDRWLRAERLTQQRFWTKVRVDQSCWIWTGNTATNGYGRVKIAGVSYAAHRVSYEWLVGPIPEGMELDHVADRGCTSRACVNPRHLEPVTHKVNTLRGQTITAAQAARTHCPRGHELTPENLVPSSLRKGRRGCLTCSREKAAERRSGGA